MTNRSLPLSTLLGDSAPYEKGVGWVGPPTVSSKGFFEDQISPVGVALGPFRSSPLSGFSKRNLRALCLLSQLRNLLGDSDCEIAPVLKPEREAQTLESGQTDAAVNGRMRPMLVYHFGNAKVAAVSQQVGAADLIISEIESGQRRKRTHRKWGGPFSESQLRGA
jgi:hypothetical protein